MLGGMLGGVLKGASKGLQDELGGAIGKLIKKWTGGDDAKTEEATKEFNAEVIPIVNKIADQQYELNKMSLASRSVFVAGGRPFIMWVCGVALALYYVVDPVATSWFGAPGLNIPHQSLEWLVYSLLGLGGLRSIDKYNGSTNN